LCRNGDCDKVRALWVRFAAARSRAGKPRLETGMNYQRRKPNSTPPNRERARELDLAETKTTQQGRQKKREWQSGRQRRAPRSLKRRRKQKIKVRSCEPHCAQTTKRASRAREPKKSWKNVATAAVKGSRFYSGGAQRTDGENEDFCRDFQAMLASDVASLAAEPHPRSFRSVVHCSNQKSPRKENSRRIRDRRSVCRGTNGNPLGASFFFYSFLRGFGIVEFRRRWNWIGNRTAIYCCWSCYWSFPRAACVFSPKELHAEVGYFFLSALPEGEIRSKISQTWGARQKCSLCGFHRWLAPYTNTHTHKQNSLSSLSSLDLLRRLLR
jgi:hypothetical protein